MSRPNYNPQRKPVARPVDNARAERMAQGQAKFRKGGRRRKDLTALLATDAYNRRDVPITLPKLKFLEGSDK